MPRSSTYDYDLLIIGGGPAGSLTAALVRRQDPDRRVLLLEREVFPRHHVGESTIPSWLPILERAGVTETLEASGMMRKVGTLFQWGGAADESWTIDFRDEQTGGARTGSYQVDRARLDHILLRHARGLGAEVLEGATVKALEPLEEGGHRVRWTDSAEGSATAAHVVDASGQARVVSRLLGLTAVPFDEMNNFAVYGYWRGSQTAEFAGPPVHERERWTYIATSPDGWVWHIPIAPDLVSVGVVTDVKCLPAGGLSNLEAFYTRNVDGCPKVAELLGDAELVSHPLLDRRLSTIRDWSYHVARVCGPGFFLAGDAAAFVDPILSSGLLLAANGASLAANALHTIWNDPDVDVELLRESYQSTYDDMASSYHRLAGVWYSRNFSSSTWHWEAKRQRLRTGRHPAAETDAQAFQQVCLGSFANPVEGAFADRGVQIDLARPDARIYAAHLFEGEVPVGDVRGDELSEEELRARIASETAARWRELLERVVVVRGVRTRTHESYFSDATMGEWKRVRYVEVAPEGSSDPFDRVVFAVTEGLPRSVVPLLEPERTVREVLERLGAAHPVGGTSYTELLELAQQQVLQLDLRGWLLVEPSGEPAASANGALPWPPGLGRAIAAVAPAAELSVDPLGTSLTIVVRTPGAAPGVTIAPSALASRQRVWRQKASTAISYRGDPKAVAPLMRSFLSWLDERERARAGAMRSWWSEEARRVAGERAVASSLA